MRYNVFKASLLSLFLIVGLSACKSEFNARNKTAVVDPESPQISFFPASPANNNSPVIKGSATADSTIDIYSSAGCSGTLIASMTASQYSSSGYTLAVANNSTNNYSVKSTIGSKSMCTSATYVEDSTNPLIAITTAPTWINVSNAAAYVVGGTCSDALSGITANVTVTITDGVNSVTGTSACTAGSFSASVNTGGSTPGSLSNGSNNISITASVSDAAGNSTTTGVTTRSKDTTAPTIASVTTATATNSNPGIGVPNVVDVTITFSETVTLAGGVPQLTLNTTPARTADYVSGSPGTALLFNYTIVAGDASARLDYANAATSLSLNGGTLVDQAGNSATLTLPALTMSGLYGTNIKIDTSAVLEFVVGLASPTPPDPDDFGTVSANVTHTYTVTNNGRGDTSSPIGVSLLNGSVWAIGTDNCTGNTLATSASCTVQVTFNAGTSVSGAFTDTLNASAASGGSADNDLQGTVACPNAAGKTTYAAATTGTTYTVPGGCTSIAVKMWGAGGGSGNAATGGGGGYVAGTIAVTPGDSITVKVGGGGDAWNAGGTNGGGTSGLNGAGGGGYSSVDEGGTYYIVAGAGGGSAGYNGSSAGAGGGVSGLDGVGSFGGHGGTGGTAFAGGTGGTSNGGACGAGNGNGTAGSALQGGTGGGCTGWVGGGGGGAGWFGGGGGGGDATNAWIIGGGGGGSSYTSGVVTGVTNTAGSGATPGNAGDGDRGTAGEGGNNSGGTDGKVVITPAT